MRQILAITEPRQWQAIGRHGQEALLAVLRDADGGVDLRLPLHRDAAWLSGMAEIAQQAAEAGCRVRAHAWVGRGDRDDYAICTARDGETDAPRLVASAVSLPARVERLGINAEHHVHRGRGDRWHTGAEPYLAAMTSGLRVLQTGAVDYVGFPSPATHYKGPDGKAARWTPGHVDIYDGLGAMMYQLFAHQLVRRWRSAVLPHWPLETQGRRRPRSWWTGIGRKAGTGGDYSQTMIAWRELAETGDEPQEVTWYCGLRQTGAVDGEHQPHKMLIDGRPGHPPLVGVIPLVAREWPA